MKRSKVSAHGRKKKRGRSKVRQHQRKVKGAESRKGAGNEFKRSEKAKRQDKWDRNKAASNKGIIKESRNVNESINSKHEENSSASHGSKHERTRSEGADRASKSSPTFKAANGKKVKSSSVEKSIARNQRKKGKKTYKERFAPGKNRKTFNKLHNSQRTSESKSYHANKGKDHLKARKNKRKKSRK